MLNNKNNNEKQIEQMIEKYKHEGWTRLFPDNPDLEECFMK